MFYTMQFSDSSISISICLILILIISMKTFIKLGKTQYHSENNHIISEIIRKMEGSAEIAMEFGLMPHKDSIIPLPRGLTHKLNHQFCDILPIDI